MLIERLRHCKNASARPEPDPRSRPGIGQGRQPPVEAGKAFGRSRAVTSRNGIKRRVQLGILIEAVSDTAQADDFGSDRKRGHELSAL